MIYNNIELYNVEELIPYEDGFLLSRVPVHVRAELNPNARETALNTCGCEIRFNMHSESAKVLVKRKANDYVYRIGAASVYNGSFHGHWSVCNQYVEKNVSEIIVKRPDNLELLKKLAKESGADYSPELVRILLPYDAQTIFIGVEGQLSPPRPEQAPKNKYLAYGSSITHGGSAVRPAGTYAMRVARGLGADLINLGFAGSAQLDPAMADYIAERKDWEVATLELGINVVEAWTAEEFAQKVDCFISRIAEAHPDQWIFCTGIYRFYMDYDGNPKGKQFRDIVKKKVQEMHMSKLIYVPGEELLSGVNGLTADLTHPSEDGMEELSQHWISVMKNYF